MGKRTEEETAASAKLNIQWSDQCGAGITTLPYYVWVEDKYIRLQRSHSHLQFKYSSDRCAKQNAISRSVRLEAENKRLEDGLINLATATLIREHSIKALVSQLRDIHHMACSILVDIDIDALKETADKPPSSRRCGGKRP
jgi:hypothetical protein